MTETDPPDRCGVDDPRHGFTYEGEHALHAGMEEERFLVLDEEMVELKFDLGFVDRNAIDVRSDLELGFTYEGEHALHAGMEEERFLVLDEEMVELKFDLGFVDRNAIDVRSDLGNGGHDPLLKERWISGTNIIDPLQDFPARLAA